MNEPERSWPSLVVRDRLQQRAADALHHAADDLRLGEHRVHQHAAVVRDDVALEPYAPGLDVDLDDRRVRGIGPGDGRRLEVVRLLQPGVDLRRTAVVPARTRGPRDLRQRHAARPAHRRCRRRRRAAPGRRCAHSSMWPAMANTFFLQLARSRWWIAAGNGHRGAARDRAEAHRDRGGVAERAPPRRRAPRPRRRPRSARRPFPCPGPAGRRRRRRGSFRDGVDAHRRAFERADAGALGVAAEPEPEIAALLARASRWRSPECVDAAERIERLLQSARVVAAVVDDRLAVAIGNAQRVRHLLRAGSCCAAAPRPARASSRRRGPSGAPSPAPPRDGPRRGRVRSAPCWSPRRALSTARCGDPVGPGKMRRGVVHRTATPSGFHAPQSTTKRSRSARMRPSSSKAISASWSWSREWQEHRRCSRGSRAIAPAGRSLRAETAAACPRDRRAPSRRSRRRHRARCNARAPRARRASRRASRAPSAPPGSRTRRCTNPVRTS